jgi:hypothetical protein
MPQILEQDSTLSSAVSQVAEGERVRLRVGDREVAVISLEDLDFLEEVEDKIDLLDALDALQEASKDKRIIPWENILEDIKRDRQADGL